MGWAGPAQPTGPDSAQNCWADFGPKWVGLISAQKKLTFSSGLDPAQKRGLGQDPPGPSQNGAGGNYFPPHPCMQNATRSACGEGNEKNKREKEGEEKLPGAEEAVRRWRCCGRGWWRCRSSRTAAPGGAAAVPNVRFPFLPMFRSSLFFPSLSSLSLFFFPLFFFMFFSPLGFSLLSVLPLSLLCFFCFLLLPSPLFSSLPLLIAAVLAVIYRAK